MNGKWMTIPPKKRKVRRGFAGEPVYYVEGQKDGCSIVYTCKGTEETEKAFVELQEKGYHIAVFKAGRRRVRLEWFCCSALEYSVPVCEWQSA